MAAVGDKRLYLPAQAGNKLFIYGVADGKVAPAMPISAGRVQLSGASAWSPQAILLANKLVGEVLCYDLATGRTTRPTVVLSHPLRFETLKPSNTGLATASIYGRCYLLEGRFDPVGGVLRIFQVTTAPNKLTARLVAESQLILSLLPMPSSVKWRYADLVYDSIGNRLLALRTFYIGPNTITNQFLVQSIALGQHGELLSDAKLQLVLSLTGFVNARAAYYYSDLAGLAVVGGWLYVISNHDPANSWPALFFRWPLRIQ